MGAMSSNEEDPEYSEDSEDSEDSEIRFFQEPQPEFKKTMYRPPCDRLMGFPCNCQKRALVRGGGELKRMKQQYFTARLMRGLNDEDRKEYLESNQTGGHQLKGLTIANREKSRANYDVVNDTIQALIEKNKFLPGLLPSTWQEYIDLSTKKDSICSRLCDDCWKLYSPRTTSYACRMYVPLQPAPGLGLFATFREDKYEGWTNGSASGYPTGLVVFDLNMVTGFRHHSTTFMQQRLHESSVQEYALKRPAAAAAAEPPPKRQRVEDKVTDSGMSGKYLGELCEECDKTAKNNDEKRVWRDRFLFSKLTVDDKSDLVKGRKGKMLKGWTVKMASETEVIDLIMTRLAGTSNLPKTWDEYKKIKANSGALCDECWVKMLEKKS